MSFKGRTKNETHFQTEVLFNKGLECTNENIAV